MISLICGILKEKKKKEDKSELISKTYSYQRGKGGWGGIKKDVGINIYTLLYTK